MTIWAKQLLLASKIKKLCFFFILFVAAGGRVALQEHPFAKMNAKQFDSSKSSVISMIGGDSRGK